MNSSDAIPSNSGHPPVDASEEFKRGWEWAMRWGWREKCLKAEAEVRRLQGLYMDAQVTIEGLRERVRD